MRRSALLVFLLAQPALAERVIVELRPGATLSRHRVMNVTDRWQSVNAFGADLPAAAIDELRRDPAVLRVSADLPGGGALRESVPQIGGNLVGAMGHRGGGIVVAVLDSGIDPSHPDLDTALVGEQCYCRNFNGTGCCPNGQTSQSGTGAAADDHGHGTRVTGVIASKGTVSGSGVAPDVKIVSVKVLDNLNRFSALTQVISALDWIVMNRPDVRVVNMSLLTDAHFGGACDQSFSVVKQLVDILRSRGTLVFAASGNTGSATSMGSPACVSSVVAVGAVYDAAYGVDCGKATAPDVVTCFSDGDPTLDLLAPGAVITTTQRGGGTTATTGTSFATPHAAGAAAVLFGIDPTLTASSVETLLKITGRKLVDTRNGVTTPRVDVYAAVQALLTPKPARRRAIGR
jgi:subtilisin family serine protease